jgi:3-phosphoshikimate 1-carboxyvinyltransferase
LKTNESLRTFELEASKSLFNRALIVQSFFPDLKIIGRSSAEDVQLMRLATGQLCSDEPEAQVFDCGAAGTVLRFFALRLSREKGLFFLKGSKRLFQRPQLELQKICDQLGVQILIGAQGLQISGQGWFAGLKKESSRALQISREDSSQFASAVLLSAWNLDFDLALNFSGDSVSDQYFQMTLGFVRQLGMQVIEARTGVVIQAHQQLKVTEINIEPDYSSMASLAVFAALSGDCRFLNCSERALQPDARFPVLMNAFGVNCSLAATELLVSKSMSLSGAEISLAENPDLLPVFAVLASFSEGLSQIHVPSHVRLKESDRLQKSFELLHLAGVECEIVGNCLNIEGQGLNFTPKEFVFNPDQDHRMAMAAGLFKLRNSKIEIETPEVVDKSYPLFWSDIGVTP